MSGIVGIAGADSAVLNPGLLDRLTEALRFRGPDACRTWAGPGIGFGHALLATTDGAERDRQPADLDGALWITADARIDGRRDLVRALEASGERVEAEAGDAALILHAYRAWADQCVDHLLGDFAFAIWDVSRRRLFCARDHFGVKPFYYAEPAGAIIVSNTLACVRRHPAVARTLDDVFIADFLLFKYSQRPDATAFEAIRRLPPGHALTWTPGASAAVRRYWRLAESPEIRYRDPREYVERFREIFREAVADRLRTRRVAVAMSGGLDSPAIAAAAKSILAADPTSFDLRAHTVVLDHVVPDEERRFAGLVAARLGIRISFFAADHYPAFPPEDETPEDLPEPGDSTFRTLELDFAARMASTTRVVLRGDDADSFLAERTLDYFAELARRGRLVSVAAAMTRYAFAFKRRPPVGARRMLRSLVGGGGVQLDVPAWLNRDLVRRLRLDDRVRDVARARATAGRASLRPRSIRASEFALWAAMFGRADAEVTRQPVEFRYPFADLRLVRYMLAVPVVPWCTDKAILRESLRGVVPEAVRRRRKTPVAVDPLRPALRRPEAGWLDGFTPAAALDRYVDRSRVPRVTGETGADVYVNLRPLCLSRWLDRQSAEHDRSTEHVTRTQEARDLACTARD